MSTRSRLGKGLGALFPALPGEALPSETPTSETPLPETAPHDEAKQPAAQAGQTCVDAVAGHHRAPERHVL